MSEVLSSWKDVAAHLGKSVRTVQRWEVELGLPIHRPSQRQQRIILAYPEELTKWVAGQHARASGKDSVLRLETNRIRLLQQLRRLRSLSETLQRRTASGLDRLQRVRSLARRASASQS